MTGRKGGNRLKKKRTAILSGLLAAVCVISSVLQPASASASSAVSPVYPGLSEVRAQLDDDEIITAEDITVVIGSDFDIVNDRTGFVIPDDTKVSILFDGAVDEKGTAFSIEKASDYSARYHVDMKSGHPSYQIIRTITVTEKADVSESLTGSGERTDAPAGTENAPDTAPNESSAGTAENNKTSVEDSDTENFEPSADDSKSDVGSSMDDADDSVKNGESQIPVNEKDKENTKDASGTSHDSSISTGTEDSSASVGNSSASAGNGSALAGDSSASAGNSSTQAGDAADPEIDKAWAGAEEALAALTASATANMRFRLFAAAPKAAADTEQVVINCTPGRVTYSTQGYPETPKDLFGTSFYNANGVEYSMYCITPDRPSTPGMGTTVTAARMNDPTMRKLLYYGYLAPGYNASQKVRDLYESLDYTDFSERSHYAYAHLAMGLAYHGIAGRGNWAAGLTARTIENVQRLYNGLAAMPNPPDAFETWMIPHMHDLIQDMAYWKPLSAGEGRLLKKSSSSGTSGNSSYSLEGAVYGVYSDEACTSKVETLTTGSDGRSNTVTLNDGTYYVKETTAPKGFRKDATVYSMVIRAGETTELSVKDEPEKGQVALLKTSSDGGTMPVTGTIYTVYSDPDCKDSVGTLKVKEDGTTSTLSLLFGTYYVKETKAADGYQLDTAVHKVTLKSTDTYTLKLSDKVIRAGVHLEKRDEDANAARAQGDASLKGTTLTITNENDYGVYVGEKTYEKGEVVLTLTSDENGVMTSSKDALPCGSYSFKETAAPEGYRIGKSASGTFKIEAADAGTLKDLTGKGPKDPVIRGGVKICKQDDHYHDDRPQGDASLAGAEYAVVNMSKGSVFVDGKEYGNGDVVMVLTTDKKGFAQADGDTLPYGSYKITEQKAPAGYLLNKEWSRSFTVREDGEIVDLTSEPCEDKVIRGGVAVEKHDKELDLSEALGGASLKGIEFTIRNASEERVHVMGADYGKGEAAARLVTDEEGRASLAADVLPYGTYTIQETGTNGSYLLTDGKARTFRIRKNGETVTVGTDEKALTFRDQVVRNDIRFNKIADGSNARMQGIAFKVTNLTTGEAHVIVTDKNGSYRSAASSNPHTESTNANDRVLDAYKDGDMIRTEDLDAHAGTWFGLGRKGSMAEADDSLGAFPYGEYSMEELRCENNEGHDLISIRFFIDEDSTEEASVELGTLTDDEMIPEIATVALDSKTKEHLASAGETQIIDTVHCINLVPGKSYILKASAADENGAVLKSGSKKVSGETAFTAETSVMDVKVKLGSFDPGLYKGQTVTVFEKLYEKKLIGTGRLLASHEELDDADQQIRIPRIRTNAEDVLTKSHTGSIGKAVRIRDTVTFEDLIPGKEYTVKGTLHVKETTEVLKDAQGKDITAELTFTPAEAAGSVELIFTVDSSLLQGQTVVAFEELGYKGIEVAVHADINDDDQSVSFPRIRTTLTGKTTDAHEVQADTKVILTDVVDYENLPADGKTSYIMCGSLMLKPDTENGEAEVLTADGEPVVSSTSFTPESPDGKVIMEFEVDASSLAGREVVAFEECISAETGVAVASHRDIDDMNQTVKVIDIGTKAEAKDTGRQETQAGEKTELVDHVMYKGLTVGKEYTVRGKLMLQDTGNVLKVNGKEVTAEKKFRPEKADGIVDLIFTFDSTAIAGRKVVAFEYLYNENAKIASHADITDEDQTVGIVQIGTKAEAKDTGKQETTASGQTTVIDHVSYKGLVPGREYVLRGELVLSDTGKTLTIGERPVTGEVTFKPERADGTVDMTFTFDSSALAGKKVVAFEELYQDNVRIAAHCDINDREQSVDIKNKPTPTPTPSSPTPTPKTPTPTPKTTTPTPRIITPTQLRNTPASTPATSGRTTATTISSPVKTGDVSQPIIWLLLAGGAAVILAALLQKRKGK